MKLYLLTACCFLPFILLAQKVVDVDKSDGAAGNLFYSVGGEPYVNVKFVRLTSGTPYFKEEWMKGTAISATGARYKSGILKLDLVDNEVHFLDAAQRELVVNSPLKELTLTDTVTGKVYQFVNSAFAFLSPTAKTGWYLQTVSGAAGLYQFFIKQMRESRPFNSATTEQTIITLDEFYILYNSAFVRVKKPRNVPAVLSDKKAELEDYLKKTDNQKLPNAIRLAAIVNYYNSLLK